MAEGFSKNLIKGYKYWEIYVHENQGYLGRCVVWCKREDVLDLADAMPEEQAELFLVLRDLREATKKVFQSNWFNYSFLGNETRHLHGHFIPRYAKPKTFSSRQFFKKESRSPRGFLPKTSLLRAHKSVAPPPLPQKNSGGANYFRFRFLDLCIRFGKIISKACPVGSHGLSCGVCEGGVIFNNPLDCF